MRRSLHIVVLACLFAGLSACITTATKSSTLTGLTSTEATALKTVQDRTAAYQAHDIEAFLSTYAEDVRIYEYPSKFLGEGKARMRDIFGPQFSDGEGTIIVNSQLVLENTVISDEMVTIYGHTEHNIGIYFVERGLISEVRLVEPTASAN